MPDLLGTVLVRITFVCSDDVVFATTISVSVDTIKCMLSSTADCRVTLSKEKCDKLFSMMCH